MKTVHRDELSPRHDPFEKMGSLVITGSAIGGVLSIGLIVVVWGYLPEVRPFLVAALAVGATFGLVLWFRRR